MHRAFVFDFRATPPVGAQDIDRGSRRGAVQPSAYQSIGGHAGTGPVEPEKHFGAELFRLRIALQHATDDTDDAPVVLSKDRFEFGFYPATGHAHHFYTSITIGAVSLCQENSRGEKVAGFMS